MHPVDGASAADIRSPSRSSQTAELTPEKDQRRVQPSSPLFRERAVRRYQRGESIAQVLEVGGSSSWALCLTAAACVLVGASMAVFARVEVISRARGVMRPLDGIVAIAAQTEGLVSEVHVSTGQEVGRGQSLLRVDSVPVRGELIAAERELEIADEQLAHLEQQRAQLQGAARGLLDRRAELARRRIENQRDSLARLEQRVRAVAELDARGFASRQELEVLRDELAAGKRALLELQGELEGSRLESNRLERDSDDRVREWIAKKRLAEARLDTARLLLARTEVRAPLAGTIESWLVRPGAQVGAASPIGRIIPAALSDRVVVFVPERDRAFIKEGAQARLAVDQLPIAEFGWLSGRVARVARAVAMADEIRDVLGGELGADGGHYRVEVTLTDDAPRRGLAAHLRTGALLTAHITLRTQTVAALVLRPLREWIAR